MSCTKRWSGKRRGDVSREYMRTRCRKYLSIINKTLVTPSLSNCGRCTHLTGQQSTRICQTARFNWSSTHSTGPQTLIILLKLLLYSYKMYTLYTHNWTAVKKICPTAEDLERPLFQVLIAGNMHKIQP